MKLRIESDGTPFGTHVFDADNDQEIEDVLDVEWSWERGYGATVRLRLGSTPARVAGPAAGMQIG